MSSRGKFITIEGVEGAGKSTCMAFVCERLQQAGKTVLESREPGGTPLGEDLRELLLGHRHTGMSEDAELLLMFAARAEHIYRKIRPALEQGTWVVCDRFTDATYAYQGGGRKMDRGRIETIEQWVQRDLRPDLTLLMDIPVAQGLERAGKRSTPDRFESESMKFFEAVRNGYLELAVAEPDRIKTVDASRSIDDVQMQLAQVIDTFIEASS